MNDIYVINSLTDGMHLYIITPRCRVKGPEALCEDINQMVFTRCVHVNYFFRQVSLSSRFWVSWKLISFYEKFFAFT